jgi:D-amino-acid dehydrogenase
MNEPIQPETVILGAGIVGVCCARYLQMAGMKVTLIDREEVGAGCSFGNAGVLCTYAAQPMSKPDLWRKLPGWIMDPLGPVSLKLGHLPSLWPWLKKFAIATLPQHQQRIGDAMFTLNNPSIELFRQLLAGSGHENLVVDSGYVFATRKAATLDINAPEWRERARRGTPLSVLDANELRELEPAISPDFQRAIVQGGHGRVTNPGRLVKVIAEMVLADGGEFIQADVLQTAPRADGGAWLETDRGRIETNRLVICTGAWSGKLIRPFGVSVPLEGERGYHMEFRDPGITVNNSVHDADRKFVVSSMEGGVRCAGTSEFNSLTAKPDWRRAQIMKTLGQAAFPGLNIEHGSEWMGRRPAVPDSVPVIGPAPGHEGVILAFGHGTYGLTGAPMTGRLVAGLATKERHNINLEPYRVDRDLFG